MGTHRHAQYGGIHGADAEDQHRNVERQHQQRQQRAAAPGADRQRRPDGADQGQRWRAEKHGENEGGEALGAHVEEQGEHRGGDDQQHPRRQPMGQGLGEDDGLERQRPEDQKVEISILEIGLEQALERKHRGKQRRDPDDARADAGENGGIGPDAEGKENHGEDEEGHHHGAVGPPPQRQPEVTGDEEREPAHRTARSACSRAFSA